MPSEEIQKVLLEAAEIVGLSQKHAEYLFEEYVDGISSTIEVVDVVSPKPAKSYQEITQKDINFIRQGHYALVNEKSEKPIAVTWGVGPCIVLVASGKNEEGKKTKLLAHVDGISDLEPIRGALREDFVGTITIDMEGGAPRDAASMATVLSLLTVIEQEQQRGLDIDVNSCDVCHKMHHRPEMPRFADARNDEGLQCNRLQVQELNAYIHDGLRLLQGPQEALGANHRQVQQRRDDQGQIHFP